MAAVSRLRYFNPDTGEFDVENKGVSPEDRGPGAKPLGPARLRYQAVAVDLDELQQHPPIPVKRPKYPVYNWQSMRSAAASQAQGGTPAGPN